MRIKTISIIIPVYDEVKFIIPTLTAVLEAKIGRIAKEVIIVDDGSTDGSRQLAAAFISSYGKKHPGSRHSLTLLRQDKNKGKGVALRRGIIHSHGDVVLIQDADLEYSPVDYPRLLEPFVREDADVVYGSRFITDRPHRVMYFWHHQVNKFLTFISNLLTNLNLSDMETGYKVFRGALIRRLAPYLRSKRFGFEPEVTAYVARVDEIKFYEVGVRYAGRTYAQGKKIDWRDGLEALWCVVIYNLFVRPPVNG